jgi:phosphatidylglycerophosphate synthase
MADTNEVSKQIPSVLENSFAKLTDRWADRLPGSLSPNQITAAGLIIGALGAVCFGLASLNRWFFIGAIIGVAAHLIADNFDGFYARKWNKCSKSGAYFDIMSDVLVTTLCLICIGLGNYANFRIVIFLVPLYGIYYITALHSIYLIKVFPFPRMGPFEVHLSFVLIALLNHIFGTVSFSLGPITLNLTDVIMLGGLAVEAVELAGLSRRFLLALGRE